MFFYLLEPAGSTGSTRIGLLSLYTFSTHRVTRAGDDDSPIDLSARVRQVHLVHVAFHDALWFNTMTNQRCNTI